MVMWLTLPPTLVQGLRAKRSTERVARGPSNRVRIIGGEFGGRRLDFPNQRGLRPTADRVRETLFNWLMPELPGARVLDLFAGSGALGLEALSRGAGFVLLVEQARAVAERLRQNLALLGAEDRAQVRQADALRLLSSPPETPFDIVFLDPPFAAGLLVKLMPLLASNGWLADDAWVYLEQDASQPWPPLPEGWTLHREGKGGQAAYRLVHASPALG
jgi:16S rRNA (guanine966-N2)-methyltransferase